MFFSLPISHTSHKSGLAVPGSGAGAASGVPADEDSSTAYIKRSDMMERVYEEKRRIEEQKLKEKEKLRVLVDEGGDNEDSAAADAGAGKAKCVCLFLSCHGQSAVCVSCLLWLCVCQV